MSIVRRLLVLGVLLGACPILSASIPQNIRIQCQLTPSNRCDTAHRDGNDGTGPIPLIWATIPNQTSKPEGTSYSVNLRTGYLTEAGSPDATLAVNCSPTLGSGWSATADGLSYSGTGIYSATCSVTATRLTASATSNSFAVSSVAAAASDTTAPSIPGNLIGTPATNAIDWSWDPSTDQHDGTNNGSGLKEYDLELNGAVTTVADSAPGLVTALTQYVIGSPTGTNTTSQSGGQWTITAAGTGIDSTADQLVMRGGSITGDFQATVKVASITSNGSTHAPNGLMARASSAAGAQYTAIYQKASAQSQAVEGKVRVTTDGPKTNLALQAGTSTPRCLRMERAGAATANDTWTLSSSIDCTTYSALATQINVMPATVIVGPFASSMVAGTANVAVFQELSISTRPRLTYHQSTASSTTARLRARDLKTPTPNVSAYSATVTAAPNVVSAPAVKWHPGYYVLQTSPSNYTASQITEIASIANIQGWSQVVNWSTIETSRGVYNWSFIDTLLQLCKDNGKRLIIRLMDRNFSGGNPLPAYLATESGGGGGWYTKSNGQVQAKVYLQPIMDRYLALMQAVGARYDTDPYLEGVENDESSLNEATLQSDYTESAYLAQYLRLIQTAPTYFPHTNVWIGLNFGFSQSNFPQLTAAMAASRAGMIDPDVATGNTDNSDNGSRAIRGLIWDGAAWVSGGVDRRGQIPISHDWQGPELGGKEGGFTYAQLYNQAYNVNHDSHMSILRKAFRASPNPPEDQYWDNTQSYAVTPASGGDIKTYLSTTAASNPARTTCPTVYTGGCDTSTGSFDYYLSATGSNSNPCTIVLPCAITAITSKSATFAGKHVGLLDGTYDIYSAWVAAGSVEDDYLPFLQSLGGTAANPTIIQAVNPRAAVLVAKSGSNRIHQPVIGRYGTQASSSYLQIRDLTIQGGGSNSTISFYGTDSQVGGAGIVISGNDISDMLRVYGNASDNTSGVWLTGHSGALISDNKFTNIHNPNETHNACGVMLYGAQNTIIEKNDFSSMPAGIFDKQQSFYSLPNIGTIARYNYFDSINNPIYGFSNGSGTAHPYAPYYVYNNVIENSAEPFMTEYGTLSLKSPVYFYNNTIIANTSNSLGYATVWMMSKYASQAYFYNNIMNSTHASPGYQGRLVYAPGGWALSNYNLFGPSFDVGLTPGLDDNGSTTNYTALSSWQALVGNPDANSLIISSFGFLGTGSGPEKYKLTGGSTAINFGHVGGVGGGAAVNAGAYSSSSQNEQIGASW